MSPRPARMLGRWEGAAEYHAEAEQGRGAGAKRVVNTLRLAAFYRAAADALTPQSVDTPTAGDDLEDLLS